jgi:hypothetical protein
MGGKMVIGGWLLSATQQAIVAAFGAEGTEVIRKTNDYLNAIAKTDPPRAQQLAMFINEDPMLVCSLVETSKTRWLVNDGVSYINTGFIPNTNSSVECMYQVITHSGSANAILGCRNVRGKDEFMIWIYTDYITRGWGATGQPTVATGVNVSLPHEIGMGNGWFLYDGTRSTQATGNFTGTIPCYLFCCNTLGSPDSQRSKKAQISYAIFGGDTQAHFIPMQRTDGTCGMLDIISGTFYPNANTEGSFTIAITDKTPA